MVWLHKCLCSCPPLLSPTLPSLPKQQCPGASASSNLQSGYTLASSPEEAAAGWERIQSTSPPGEEQF